MDPQNNGKESETLNEYTSIRRDNLSFDATFDMGINSKDSQQDPKVSNFESDFLEINQPNYENVPIRQSKYFASDSAINNSKELRHIIIGGIIFSVSITLALIIQILVGPSQIPNRVGIITQEKVCSDIGAEIVNKGGNSVDAYIASSLCLSVVNPFAAGLGAGGFLLIRDHKHDSDLGLNCFFKSSSNAKSDDYKTNPQFGRKSVAIPGELKCLQYVYHKYARLYWNTLAEPAIGLALNGFKVSNLLARHLERIEDLITNNEYLKSVFLDEKGMLVKEGSLVKNPNLARTIQSIIKKESNFYIGEKGRNLVDFLSEKSHFHITANDLFQYSEQEKSVKISNFNDFVLLSSSYPSAGPALKFIIDSLSNLSISTENIRSADTLAKILEASKMGYIFSSSISDSKFAKNQSEMFNEKLIMAKNYLLNRNDSVFPFEDNVQIKDSLVTNFISVNDHNDLMVSYVGTLGSAWGSQLFINDGYFLNNGLSLFSYEDDNEKDLENQFAPGKQPRGLMTPILSYNKKNPCVRRYSISYNHQDMEMIDDFGLSELSQIITRLFTDFSEKIIEEKRFEYSPEDRGVCFENEFDQKVKQQIIDMTKFVPNTKNCSFHSIGLVMKKDHVVYGYTDSNKTLVVLN